MSWTAELLNVALDRWNETLDMIWELLTKSPDEFKGGAVWGTIVNINGAVQAIGYALLVLFFCLGICRSTINFRDFRRPEYALRHFIYFVAAKAAITYGMELMEAVRKMHSEQPLESIECIGLCTDICVVSNALLLKAALPEVPVYVDASCCAGTTPENHQAALTTMACCQVLPVDN